MIILSKKFTKEKFQAIFQAQDTEEGMRLDQFVMEYFSTWSRQMIKRKIDVGDIFIKDRPGKNKPSTRIRISNEVYVESFFEEEAPEIWNNQEVPLEKELPVIFEDEELFAVSKPAFMAVHPTGKHIFHVATVILEDLYKQSPLYSVHRIDRETSGLLLIAKNSKSANLLTKQFEASLVKKAYFFIGKNKSNPELHTLMNCKQRLGTDEVGLKRVYVKSFDPDTTQGKHAETDFIILEKNQNFVYGLAFPKTGRQHQIRVHAQYLGFPLVGDKLYLGDYEMFQRFKDGYAQPQDYAQMMLPRHALHATAIKIKHAGSQKIFIAPIAKDFEQFLKTHFNASLGKVTLAVSEIITKVFSEDSFQKN